MHKIVEPSSWDFGEAITQLVKVSSKGLVGKDYSVLVKRAGEEFAFKIKNAEIDKDQVPVHAIAMGATEFFGCNRNADGFKAAALKKHHDTFVKHANWYRHHQNKDPDKRYGTVKASHYNDAMGRVELLGLLNGNKSAADKFGGLVADKELETLNSDRSIGVSMACKVAYDVCSGCGNKARNRDEYCTEDTCKYGGCKDNLSKVAEDGHVLHVDNPEPDFFDISTVVKPADRIAYGDKADYLSKSASDASKPVGGAALADYYGIVSPLALAIDGVSESAVANQIKLAYKLASVEDTLDFNDIRVRNIARAFDPALQPMTDIPSFVKLADVLSALASQNVVLPVRDFIRLVSIGESNEKTAALAAAVSGCLPGIYNRLIATQDLKEKVRNNSYTPSQKLASANHRQWAEKVACIYSIEPDAVRRRSSLSAIRSFSLPTLQHSSVEKQASSNSEANDLAIRYALYKLATLYAHGPKDQLTYETAIVQNYI